MCYRSIIESTLWPLSFLVCLILKLNFLTNIILGIITFIGLMLFIGRFRYQDNDYRELMLENKLVVLNEKELIFSNLLKLIIIFITEYIMFSYNTIDDFTMIVYVISMLLFISEYNVYATKINELEKNEN